MRFDPDAYLAGLLDDLSGSAEGENCRESRNCRSKYSQISTEKENAERTKESVNLGVLAATLATTATEPPNHTSIKSICKIQDAFAALERSCPEHIPTEVWRRAVADGRNFMEEWRLVTEELGWTAEELFGLHEPPGTPHQSYDRLARYDCTGLVWLLKGNQVIEITEREASIRYRSGSVTVYRKHNKPGLGPVGDSLDDFK